MCIFPPIFATMLLNGGDCLQSDNMQALNFTCCDFNGGSSSNEGSGDEVYIIIADDANTGTVLFDGLVLVRETFPLYNNGSQFGDS